MSTKTVSMTLLCMVLFSCTDNPSGPNNPLLILEPSQITYSQTDYYDYRVTAGSGILTSDRIGRVDVGTLTDSLFLIKASVTPTVAPEGDQYRISFDVTARFKDTTSRSERIRVQLVKPNGESVCADTLVPTYKYPYSGAELVLIADGIPTVSVFQDVVFLADTMFFRPTADHGIHKVDPVTGSVRELNRYPGGDHLAADSGIIFIDNHSTIQRWNTSTSLFEQVIVRFGDIYTNITGMDILDGRLVVLAVAPGNIYFRSRFDYQGTLIDSIGFVSNSYYLAIRNSILHTISFHQNPRMLRFTLAGSPLPAYYPPVRTTWGIKFHGDYLYYCDYNRRAIGRVPSAELREMP